MAFSWAEGCFWQDEQPQVLDAGAFPGLHCSSCAAFSPPEATQAGFFLLLFVQGFAFKANTTQTWSLASAIDPAGTD